MSAVASVANRVGSGGSYRIISDSNGYIAIFGKTIILKQRFMISRELLFFEKINHMPFKIYYLYIQCRKIN